MKRRFTILTAALALLVSLALPMGMMGQTRESYNVTYSYDDLGDMLYGSYLDASSYWKVPETSGNNAVISIPITYQPESDITVTFRIATFGSGNNPSSSNTTITAAGTESNSNWSGSGVSTYPSSSTYVNGVMTITKPQNPTTLGGLDITMGVNTGVKIFRLQSVIVSYTYGGGTPTPTTYTVTYDCNGGTSGCPQNLTGLEAGDEITLADGPVKDGFDFAGWSDGNNTYDEGYEYTVNGNVTFTAQWNEIVSGDEHWVLTELADLTSSDVFVIVGNGYAMTNNNGTSSAPATSAVTITGNEITSTVAANIKWTVSGNTTNGYTFYPNGSTTTWLYCNTTASSSSNNNMRVGTGNRKAFVLNTNNYLLTKDDYTTRYLSIYDNSDWRGYVNTNLSPAISFYKKTTGSLPPSITANNVNIAYNATSGEIEYTLNNPATDGNLSISENVDWISNAAVNTTESKVTFTTTANEANTSREGVITLTYTYGDNETVTKDVTITQAAAPVIYTTIPALFDAATSTATDVNVTFGGWVVSAVKGSNAYLTDNQGNGLIIYASEHGFQVNDVLTGTVSCKLQLYRGSAELTELTTSTEGLTVAHSGTVTEQNIAISELGGVNTGALLAYQGLTYNGTALVDSDNNTITPYSTLFSYTFENGKTYNVKGIYLQYNSTKELLPRSAEDIVEVEVQHEQYTLTVSNLSHVNLFIFGGEESETIISTEDGETTAQVYDGTEVLVSIDVEAGYVFQSLTITDGNGDPVVTEELTPNEYYSFLMPTSNVTITATAEALTGDNYELFNGALVEGDYLIVYNGKAMNNTVSSNRLQYLEVNAYNDVITTDNAEIVWHIAPSGDYWTIFSADANAYAASTGNKNQATTMTDGTDNKALWTVSGNYDFVNKYNSDNNINSYLRNNGTYGFACYGTTTGGALSLYKKVEDTPVTETYTLTINGYEAGSLGGYYLIASPVAVDPATVEGMTDGDFDLYYFDEAQDDEWRNYKPNTFNLEPGKGYLYAKQATTEGEVFNFTLTGTPYDGDGKVTLKKTDNTQWSGTNLVGNPFGEIAYIEDGRKFYTMQGNGTEILASTSNSIQAMEGVFVVANEDEEEITFTTTQPTNNGKSLVLNLSNGHNVIDRAIVCFGEGHQLPKFQLRENSTKLYIKMDNQDYAVVCSEEAGAMPVNFKAENNGTYNLSLSSDNVEFAYLHLIDNLTGNDVDLLQTPTYSFEARTTDYANRFKLVFATGNNSNDDNFAFFSNGSFVINNEGNATLQVVDVTGRLISSETINGCANVNVDAAPGVYMLRLVNGENVKMQKVVVR